MSIKVTYDVLSTAQAVACLYRGDTLFCRESGEGWQLNQPTLWSKRAIRRLISCHRSDAQSFFNIQQVHFCGSHET